MNIIIYPNEILINIFKFSIVSDIYKLIIVNKELSNIIKEYIKTFNNYDLFILNRIESLIDINNINELRNYISYYISYNDVITSSIDLNIFSKFIKLINIKPDLHQLNYIDMIFNYTISTKKLFKKNIIDIKKKYKSIIIQNDIFNITPSSVLINDFKIFKLLLYINQKFITDNKIRIIISITLITQLIKYFYKRYLLDLENVCNKNNNKFIYNKILKCSKEDILNCNEYFIEILINFKNIYDYDISLYNIYSIYVSDTLIYNKDKYDILSTILSPFIENIKENLLYDKISADIINYNETGKYMQINTIKIMMDIVNNDLINIKIYIIYILFKYLNNVIEANILVDDIKNNKSFLKSVYDKCDELSYSIKNKDYDDNTLNIGITIFNNTKNNIKNLITLS